MNSLESLAEDVAELFQREPSLVRVDFPRLLVVGDTHGDVDSTRRALSIADETGSAVVFLGDYVDRGPYQLENIQTVFENKQANPKTCILLRGNHETLTMNTYYGFLDVASRRVGVKGYRKVLKAFASMPYAALYNNRILLLHGGIAKGLNEVGQLETLPRGEEDVEDVIAAQVLWNDPREGVRGFVESDRGAGAYYFGEDVFNSFMDGNGLGLLVRSHEPMPNGYRYLFKQRLLTVFSCRYYGVTPKAAMLSDKGVELVELG